MSMTLIIENEQEAPPDFREWEIRLQASQQARGIAGAVWHICRAVNQQALGIASGIFITPLIAAPMSKGDAVKAVEVLRLLVEQLPETDIKDRLPTYATLSETD